MASFSLNWPHSIPSSESKVFNFSGPNIFSRDKYFREVHSNKVNKLACVIISSYRLNLSAVETEFKGLFDYNAAVPTFLLHGEKGRVCFQSLFARDSENYVEVQMLPAEYHPNQSAFKKSTSQDGKYQGSNSIPVPKRYIFIAEVAPQFPLAEKEFGHNNYSSFIPGVHHPKYMLLFTAQGLHVIISTGNFTVQDTVDLSWCQYFPRRTFPLDGSHSSNDFGVVLEDFLQRVCDWNELDKDNTKLPSWSSSRSKCGLTRIVQTSSTA